MVSISRSNLRLLAFATSALAAASSFGIVATTSYGATSDTQYPYVGYLDGFGGSGVAVGPNAFLTAGHVVGGGASGGTFILGGTAYSIASSVAAPDIVLSDGRTSHVDLTMVYVNGTFPGYYNVGTSVAPGSAFTMVGYGQTGGVNSDGLGYTPNFISGDRLSGVNTVDASGEYYIAPGTTGLNGTGGGPNLYSYLYKAGDAVQAGGDSGGGWFQGNTLIGISDFVFNNSEGLYPNFGFASANTAGFTVDGTTVPAGTPYFGSGAIDLTDPRLRSFMSGATPQATPEPGTCAALGLGAMALLRRRRRS